MRILTVCLGNICRSPLAEGVLRNAFEEKGLDVYIDSCGTAAYHEGELADPRSIETARAHGIDITAHRARQFDLSDFDEFDLILTMDNNNHRHILSLARSEEDRKKVRMMMDRGVGDSQEVPDPYYGGPQGFEQVFAMLESASGRIVEEAENG